MLCSQHNIVSELSTDPTQSSFFKAMQLAVGTLSIIDGEAYAYTRIWCSFEVSMTLADPDKKYEIATFEPSTDKAVVISDGPTPEDDARGTEQKWRHSGGRFAHKADRERLFPPQLALEALKIRLQDGDAFDEKDKRRILNTIAGCSDLDGVPPVQDDKYDQANRMLRWRIGVACLEAAGPTGGLKLSDLEEPEGVDIARVYGSISEALRAQGKYQLRVQFEARILEFRKRVLPADHPHIGTSMNDLALTYSKLGRHQDAL